MKLHLKNMRQWTTVFVSGLIALGILISNEEYAKRKVEQYHIDQRGYEAQPSVNVSMAATSGGTGTIASFVITQGNSYSGLPSRSSP